MNHQDAWLLLDHYLDGSLGAVDRWAVSVHLDECPACRQHLAAQARLRGQIRDRLVAVEAPAGLAERLQQSLAINAGRPSLGAGRWDGILGLRAATVLGPAIVALWLLARVTAPMAGSVPELHDNLYVAHGLFAQDESLLDVVGDAPAAAAWFRDELGMSVSAPELAGYEFMGGRLLALQGQPVAQLVYESHPDERYVSLLYVAANETGASNPERRQGWDTGHRETLSIVTWPSGNGRAALIGDVPESELQRLATGLAGWPGEAPPDP